MTVEQAQRANKLCVDLKNNLDQQHNLLLDTMKLLNDYQLFLLEQLKKARDNV